MDDKFINFNGSLDNEPIEIPDKNSNSKDSSRKKVEDILNQIKSSEKDDISESFFEEMEKQLGDQFNQSSLFSLLNKMFGSGFMNSYSNDEDDEEYEDEYEDDDIVETRKFIVPKEIRYINRELLFNIPCQRLGSKDLSCFTDVANFNRIADVDPSIKEACLDVNEITIETVGEYAVILKLSQRNISFDNIFAFGIFDKDGNPKVYVPLFGNAVGVDEEDESDSAR